MVLPVPSFACEVCGKPLGARRVRQGITRHSGCRRSLRPEEVQSALGLARGTLAQLPASVADPELRELFAQAAAQARALVDDLQRLKSFVGGTPRPRLEAGEDVEDAGEEGAGRGGGVERATGEGGSRGGGEKGSMNGTRSPRPKDERGARSAFGGDG